MTLCSLNKDFKKSTQSNQIDLYVPNGPSTYLEATGLSKSVISRVIIRVTPFRVLITLLISHLLCPLGLQVHDTCSSAFKANVHTM